MSDKIVNYAQRLEQVMDIQARWSDRREEEVIQKRSLWARLKDAFSQTDIEKEQKLAADNVELVHREIRLFVPTVLWESVGNALANDPVSLARSQQLDQKISQARARRQELGDLFHVSQTTMEVLGKAKDAAEGASTMELFDVLSSNKAMSALSYMETDDAKDQLKAAQQQLTVYQKRMQSFCATKHNSHPTVSSSDITISLLDALDVFDFHSWFNMEALDNAAQQCQKALDHITPVHEEITKMHHQSRAEVNKLERQLLDVQIPFLESAMNGVPGNVLSVLAQSPEVTPVVSLAARLRAQRDLKNPSSGHGLPSQSA